MSTISNLTVKVRIMHCDLQHIDRVTSFLNHELPSMKKLVTHEITHRGLPGFVATFKKLKAWALQLISGKPDYAEEWFVTKKYLGYTIPIRFKVVFQPLVRAIIRKDSNSMRFYLSSLNIYHIVDGPHWPDVKQQIKIATQVAPSITPENNRFYTSLLSLMCTSVLPRYNPKFVSLESYRTGQTCAIFPGKNGQYQDWIAAGGPYSVLYEKLIKLKDQDFLSPNDELHDRYLEIQARTPFMGNFSAIGDTGGKTRLILIGTPYLQANLLHLKKWLLTILKELPTDCTFRQLEGVEFIKKAQAIGKTIYSVDLKDATWNFPLSLQEHIAKAVGVTKKERDLLFRSQAFNPWNKTYSSIVKGQAMGLGPSFPLFSLTHNLLLAGICRYKGRIPAQTFRVLGDDVVITDNVVYREYKSFLETYQVPISASKSITSNSLAEFAGRIIYEGIDITPIKWRRLTWESMPSLYWTYRKLRRSIPSVLMFGRGSELSYAVLSVISRKLGGLGIQESKLDRPVSRRVLRLRCGYLYGLRDGLLAKRTSFGTAKLPQKPLNTRGLGSYATDDYLRELDSQLTTEIVSKYGLLPRLVPNPAAFLSQVGEKVELLPERVTTNWDPKTGLPRRIAFMRHANNEDWNTVMRNILLEVNDVKKTSKTLEEGEKPSIIRSFFE